MTILCFILILFTHAELHRICRASENVDAKMHFWFALNEMVSCIHSVYFYLLTMFCHRALCPVYYSTETFAKLYNYFDRDYDT